MIVYRIAHPSSVYGEVLQHVKEHWDEMQANSDVLTLEPDVPRYHNLLASGMFKVAIARRDGDLVGYLMMILYRPMNTKGLFAQSHGFWVVKHPMRGLILRGLVREMVRHLDVMGVVSVEIDTIARRSAGRLLESMGFQAEKIGYTRLLRHNATRQEVANA